MTNIGDGLPGSDVLVETTSKSWLGRIVGGVGAIFFGLILVIAAAALMFWNEGRAARTAAALSEGAGLVVAVAPDSIDAANEGRLVHVAGETSAGAPARDPDFGLDANGLRLDRKVEMYQWKLESHGETQKKVGGGEETVTRYTYSREWSDHAIGSAGFRDSAGHRNPAMPSLTSHEFFARGAKLGAFAIGADVLRLLDPTDSFAPPEAALDQARAALGERARVSEGGVFAGADPAQPAIGDVRVTWQALPLAPISVVARQTQSSLSPYLASNGRALLLAEPGVVDAALMFKHGEDENRLLTWILRGVGALAMFVGFRLMLSLFETLADVVPLIGAIVGAGASLAALLCTFILAPIIVAIAWVFYRPLVAVGALVIGAALAYGVRALVRSRAAQRRRPAGAARAGGAA